MRNRTKLRPTLPRAKATLHRAYHELRHSKDDEGMRQAAEKGWRAAREAVYTVLLAGGESPHGTVGGGDVRDFENKKLAGYALGISDGYDTAKNTLHGECFYDGSYTLKEDRETIERSLNRVKELIKDCDNALSVLGARRPRR